ncbi:MAG: Hpt domain-containing protein, partial [Oligoflexales bacterium]|nr:Hpt domain-containing protein [Oligoflexales bacterium]
LLPRNCKLTINGKIKLIEMDWNYIVSNNLIKRVIATVRDVTEIKRLEQESLEHQKEMEIISEILPVSRMDFSDFICNSKEFICQNHMLIEKIDGRSTDMIAVLFRNMHTIKGEARLYGFKSICSSVHKAEQTYDILRLTGVDVQESDKRQMKEELKDVEKLIARYNDISTNKLGRAASEVDHDKVVLNRSLIKSVSEPLLQIDIDKTGEHKSTFERLRNFFIWANTYDFSICLSGMLKGMPILARELEKESPEILIANGKIRITKEENDLIKKVLIHAFRNSIDHGIETPEERRRAGKSEKGKIEISTDIVDENLRILYRDDGRGLNLYAIREKAIQRKLIGESHNLGWQYIAELIFTSGMSTSNKVTKISGRGVGMNAIKKFVESYGGSVNLILEGEVPLSGFAPFTLSITILRGRQHMLHAVHRQLFDFAA